MKDMQTCYWHIVHALYWFSSYTNWHKHRTTSIFIHTPKGDVTCWSNTIFLSHFQRLPHDTDWRILGMLYRFYTSLVLTGLVVLVANLLKTSNALRLTPTIWTLKAAIRKEVTWFFKTNTSVESLNICISTQQLLSLRQEVKGLSSFSDILCLTGHSFRDVWG